MSTNVVLIDKDDNIISRRYLPDGKQAFRSNPAGLE